MTKEITLPCGSTVQVREIRTTTEANNSENPKWLPYVSILYNGEATALDVDDLEDLEIPIQLRSLDILIDFLKEIREELLK